MSIQVVFLNNVIKIWSIVFLRGDHPTKWWLSHFKAEKKQQQLKGDQGSQNASPLNHHLTFLMVTKP